MPLKGGGELEAMHQSHGNYIVDHRKLWKNHEIVFLNFCGNPVFALLSPNVLSTAVMIVVLRVNNNLCLFLGL